MTEGRQLSGFGSSEVREFCGPMKSGLVTWVDDVDGRSEVKCAMFRVHMWCWVLSLADNLEPPEM